MKKRRLLALLLALVMSLGLIGCGSKTNPNDPPKHGGHCEKGFSEDRLHQRAAFPYHL